MKANIVFFAGGKGTRLWPISRENRPKPFVSFFGMKPLLEQLIEICSPIVDGKISSMWLSTREDLYQNLPENNLIRKLNPILEPESRDTAPALGLSSIYLIHYGLGDFPTAFIGADYVISPPQELQATLKNALTIAKQDYIITIGIPPTRPATEFGYIKKGTVIDKSLNAFKVERFVEKPDQNTAIIYLSEGNYFWNSGMFIAKPRVIWEEIQQHAPHIATRLKRIQQSNFSQDVLINEFKDMPAISFDYAVMEKTTKAAMVQATFNWEDMGNWQSIKKILSPDEQGNIAHAPLLHLEEARDMVIHSPIPIVCSKVEGLTIIITDDIVLITGEKDPQSFKNLVKRVLSKKEFKKFK